MNLYHALVALGATMARAQLVILDPSATSAGAIEGSSNVSKALALAQPEAASADLLNSTGYVQVQVISYNLYWWCVSDEQGNCPQNANGKGFSEIYQRVAGGAGGPFDLIGFQECDNIGQILGGAGIYNQFDFYDGPSDAKMAWSKAKFTKIAGPGSVWVAHDQYGNRFMDWVRLQIPATGQTVFFANTHGPLGSCPWDLGQKYVDAIYSNKQNSDMVILTGDFNCGSSTAAISHLSELFDNKATGPSYSGADHIITSKGAWVQWQGSADGTPSDHSMLKAVFGLTNLNANRTQSELVMV